MAFLGLLFWLSMPAVSQAPAAGPLPVIERFFAAYRAADVDRFVGVMAPSISFADPTARLRAEGRDEIRKMMEDVRANYSDITIDVHSTLVDGDRVAAEVTIGAVVKRKDQSPRRISVRGASFFVVRAGHIEKWTDYFDVQTLNEQMRAPQQ